MRNIRHEISKRKADWIGHILRRNCLLQWVIEGKIKGGIEVTGRRGRRRRKLLDDLEERRGYSHLKKEALDCTMWRARFGRGFGPVVRQTAKWMNTVWDSLSGKLGSKSFLDVEPHSQKNCIVCKCNDWNHVWTFALLKRGLKWNAIITFPSRTIFSVFKDVLQF